MRTKLHKSNNIHGALFFKVSSRISQFASALCNRNGGSIESIVDMQRYPIVNRTQYPIFNSNSDFSKTQYPIPNTNSDNPIAVAIAIVKKPYSIAIAIGYWVLVLHV